MGQIASRLLRWLGVEVKTDGADNRRLISPAQGLSYCISICPNHVAELPQSVSRPVLSTTIDAHHLLRDSMAILKEERLIDIPCCGSYRDPDIGHDDLYSSGLDNSSMLYLDQETETVDNVEEIKDVITSKHKPRGPAKQVFGSKAKNTTTVDFVHGSNVERATSKEIMLNERRLEPCVSTASGRCWVVEGTSSLPVSHKAFSSVANMVITSGSSQEEIKDVVMNKDEPRVLTKRIFGNEVKNMTKLDFVNDRNIEGAIVSKEFGLNETRMGSNTSSTPRRSCRVAKGTSPPVLVSQKAFNSAAIGVTTCCNLQGGITKNGSIGPYNSTQRTLLVGEGDFSFSASLAIAFGSASNMVATSLNSLDFLIKNYGNFPTNLSDLETRGSIVLHGVDATKMAKHPHIARMKFDRIIFNFPHAGFKQDSPESQIRRHQKLVGGFLRNAKKMIEKDGQIHVTHKSNAFFLKWDIPKLGTDQGLCLIQEVKFKRSKYPGYHTKYGFGGDKDFDCNPSKTYKFELSS